MAKYFGRVGFAITKETDPVNEPGVWEDTIVERFYSGDTVKQTSRWENSQNVNDNLVINCQFSILSDPFAEQNFHSIKYIEYIGALWKVSSVDVQYPRLLLTVGGIYNG